MKISGLLKNSFIDYAGLISCVVFTVGCNMDCWYCHNRDQMREAKVSEEEVFAFLQGRKGMIEAVVVSGGEPTLQPDLPVFLQRVKSMGFKVKLDTNGLNSMVLGELLKAQLLDYVAMDIKCPIKRYGEFVGSFSGDYVGEVSNSIELVKRAPNYEFRTTVVPELGQEDILEIAQTISGAKRYILQQYVYKNVQSKVVGFKVHSYDKDTLKKWADLACQYVPTSVRGY